MEKRTSKRIPVSLAASLTRGDMTFNAFIADISKQGLYVIQAPGEGNSVDHDGDMVTLKFSISSGLCLELRCKEAWSVEDVNGNSSRKIGLEIPLPPDEFKDFYMNSYYKVRNNMSHDPIAVIGMACYYPGAPDLKSFWENILARRREFRRLPEARLPLSEYYDPDPSAPDKTYGKRAAVIDGFEFDWIKRGIPKTVVASSDIVHWLALEVALRALADAGYSRENIPSDRSGVILGNTLTGEHSRSHHMRLRWPYVRKTLQAAASKRRLHPEVIDELTDTMEAYYKSAFAPITEDTLAGNLSNTIAGRICNFLDLHGGGYTVDGACSSSLIAVATAASALSNGTLDLAVAGGIDISLDTFELIGFAKTHALARADMHVYDRRASGFIPGEGAGFVVLKRLQDAIADGNYVYAVLRGWGISSDGKGGMTAPKAQTQALAIRRAYGKAGYSIREVDFIEGHGTGTIAGDKAELEGIADAMGDDSIDSLRTCGITSLKSLIGHTKSASGIGGFIKAAMAVNRRIIPPTAGCREPNQVFYEKARRVYPVMQGEQRPAEDAIRAGISGMGFGGINCHVTIESAGKPAQHIEPSVGERQLLVSSQETELFILSAASQQEMSERVNTLKRIVGGISDAEMTDLSRHLVGEGAADKPFRVAAIAASPESLVECLERAGHILGTNDIPRGKMVASPQQDIWIGNSVSRNRVGFLFPGQGSQQINMGRLLVERYPWAREFGAQVDVWLSETGYEKVCEYIYRPLDRAPDGDHVDGWKRALSRSEIAQPAICMTSLLWIRHLENLGIKPVAVGGHSLGELTAFFAAGAFDDRTLLRFAAIRGKSTAAPADHAGTMASFACSREHVEELLKEVEGYVVIANVNGPTQTVISGEKRAVEHAVQLASRLDITTRHLPVSNAFHSRFMMGAAERLFKHAPIPETLRETTLKLFSSMDGTEVPPETDLRSHFARQVTHSVNFMSLVRSIRRDCDLLVEVGPGRVLADLVKSIIDADGPVCLSVESRACDDRALNTVLGCYFVHGGEVNWSALFENRLVRPFISPSERIFIDNPCERLPFAADEEIEMHAPLSGDGRSNVVPSPVPGDSSGVFSKQQIDIMRKLIRAEVEVMGLAAKGSPERPLEESPALVLTEQESLMQGLPLPSTDGLRTPEALLRLISEMTGFPKDSISFNHRLLDDLNLDSIKAGQFVAKVAKLHGVEGKLDPTVMANSSLQEIYDRVESCRASGRSSDESPPAYEREPGPEKIQLHEATGNWVRNFKVSYVEHQRTSAYAFEQTMAAVFKEGKRVMFVSDDGEDRLCCEMLGMLTERGIPAAQEHYRTFSGSAAHDHRNVDYFVFLLPWNKSESTELLTAEKIKAMAERLWCIGTIITSMKMQMPKPTYAIVQFGNDGFFNYDADVSIEAKGSVAFFCSIHLENPGERIRVLQFSKKDDAAGILQKIAEELGAEEEISIAVFDSRHRRHVPVLELIDSRILGERKIQWRSEDVVLVTGGAKGITAECALAFAKKTGVKLALVGSTPVVEKNEEIQTVLQRYREHEVVCRYYACDISDSAKVGDLMRRVEKDLGVITGVIHGAALNRPRRVEQVTLAEAVSEIAPKLFGAMNISRCLKDNPLKLMVGFGSIIGITGMAGNAWYGFSNEILNLLLQQFGTRTKTTQVSIPAFSIWDEVGMGKRMGSLTFLSTMGILPIPKGKGVEHFMQLVEQDPGEEQVVVASRLGALNLFRRLPVSKPSAARFLEEILFYEKGVEVEAKAVLTLDNDPYLRDHVFKGTCLFPTVIGIEAMAQAVSYVTGIVDMDYLRLENVRLSYPIAVEPEGATEIHIHALVDDTAAEGAEIRVEAGITVDQTGFSSNHFEAMFVLGVRKRAEASAVKIPETFLDINPEEDLYGHMLFQGRLFQRIRAIRTLHDTQCVFDSERQISERSSGPLGSGLITGDPFFRDTLLQSVQILLPELIALPVEIEKWELFPYHREHGYHTVVVDLLQKGDDVIISDVSVLNASGEIVERLHRYKAKIIEKVQHAPRLEDMKNPDDWDEAELEKRLQSYCQRIKKVAPVISIKHWSDIHEMEKTRRHEVERTLFEKAYRKLKGACEGLPDDISIGWDEQGKPFVRESVGVGLCCSHDNHLFLCVAGRGEQGCDIETITHRSEEEWRELLGSTRAPLLQRVAGVDKSVDSAGSRIWCALEALRKATDMNESTMRYDEHIGECLIFKACDLSILTFPVRLLRGRGRMVAIAISEEGTRAREERGGGGRGDSGGIIGMGRFADSGPQGQTVFEYQFPLSLRDNATIGGGIYFANYFHWVGKAREAALKPIGKNIAEEFFGGHFMVTNYTGTEIAAHVGNHETIDARVWVAKVFGDNDASLELHFEWRKMSEGMIKPVAFSRQQLSWIRVIGHGVVESVACPEFFMAFLQNNGFLPNAAPAELSEEPSGEKKIFPQELGNILFEGDLLGSGKDAVKESAVETTMEHSNLAQNIYFSNYFIWQGHLRDQYLFSLSPVRYRSMDRNGQFVCIHSEVKHLREAMPFDRISVTMKLRRLYECGIELYFEYFKANAGGETVKLAYGIHTLAWASIDIADRYVPQKLPEIYLEKILRPHS